MNGNNFSRTDAKIKNLCFCALFAALTCVCTFISIPLPIGYFNLGDTMVLTGAWCLGPVFGTIAAALGSALADLLMGFTLYAPATAIIKGLCALIAYWVFALINKAAPKVLLLLPRALAAVLGEAIMVSGYFFYEAIVLTYGMGAVASVPGNCLQGVCGVAGSLILTTAISKTRAAKLFPRLDKSSFKF